MPTTDPKKTKDMSKILRVYSGSSNRPLAQKIAELLGVELSGLTLKQFANGEIYARYDETVRGADVFLIQSVAGANVNDMLMELLIATDAAKRASARSITAVITHYGYARQDRKAGPREPITARLVANLLECAGVDRIITLDLHQGQIQGFFDIPVNHLSALPLFADYYDAMNFDTDNLVVVSPDVGRAKAAKKLSDMLGCSLAIAHKGRPRHNAAEVMGIIGDIKGKTCIINDDMIDTAGTLCANVKELKALGAGDIYVCATHRQDRKAGPREPITARLVANLLECAGVDRIITLDLHQGQIQGFFDIPVNHLSALPLFADYYDAMNFDTDNLVVVSPDVGRAKAAKKLSDMLGCSLAIAHKGRPRHNAAEVMGIIGDIKGKTCIINDDMIDTAGTLCANVKELKALGAGDIYVCATHGIFSGPAIERLNDAPIVECVVTDAIPVEETGKIKTISVAGEFAETIKAVYHERSVSTLVGGDFAL